jgi:hypothetical protein
VSRSSIDPTLDSLIDRHKATVTLYQEPVGRQLTPSIPEADVGISRDNSVNAAAKLLSELADQREFFPAHCLGHIVHLHLKLRSRMHLLKLFHVSLSSSQVTVVKLLPSFFQSL